MITANFISTASQKNHRTLHLKSSHCLSAVSTWTISKKFHPPTQSSSFGCAVHVYMTMKIWWKCSPFSLFVAAALFHWWLLAKADLIFVFNVLCFYIPYDCEKKALFWLTSSVFRKFISIDTFNLILWASHRWTSTWASDSRAQFCLKLGMPCRAITDVSPINYKTQYCFIVIS